MVQVAGLNPFWLPDGVMCKIGISLLNRILFFGIRLSPALDSKQASQQREHIERE